jgi:putative phosphoribosyl transferase
MVFLDRFDAGRVLSRKLLQYKDQPDVLVLALPRGGVPVGSEIAHALNAPMDVFVVRKLGVPGHEELAMGAISANARFINNDVVGPMRISNDLIESVAQRELQELHRRETLYRGNRSAPDIRNKTIILVDDGLATGSSMLAAISALKQLQPARIVVAVPVAPPETADQIRPLVDDVITYVMPRSFVAVSKWYDRFEQTSDAEVRELLEAA